MRFAALSSIAVAAALGAACTSEPNAPAETEAPPLPVVLGRAELVELPRSFESGGVLRARFTATIASRVMAPIAAVHVHPGDRVRRGQPLVTLDARESTANSAGAGAALVSAEEATRAAEADARAADAQLRLARATHTRISALHDKRSATAQELDQAQAALAAAEAQVTSAEARAAAAMAGRHAAQATRDAASVAVSYAVLRAPFDGVVIERNADPGSMASPGLPLLTLEDPTAFRLEVQVDEARAGGVGVGQGVEYQVSGVRYQVSGDDADSAGDKTAVGDRWMKGRVSEIGRVDSSSHSFLVKVDVPGTGATRSGSFGRVRFTGPSRSTLAVPATSIVRRGQLTIVFAVDGEGRARLRPISPGATINDVVEVLAGLGANEPVVVSPPAGLVDGMRVVGQ